MADITEKSEAWWAILPASGSGERFQPGGPWQDKLLAPLGERPVLAHTIARLLAVPDLTGITLVAPAERHGIYTETLTGLLPADLPFILCAGGTTRRASVANGLATVPDTTDTVLIHDAARPLVRPMDIVRCLQCLTSNPSLGGVVLGHPVTDTIKRICAPENTLVQETVDRATLWQVQTPQVFRRNILLAAHQAVPPDTPVTDDAQLLEISGLGMVQLVAGERHNLKITTADDHRLAAALLL
ncbi:MAG: 2-C-methyl-D-erythritol 4-phosphate cytidylyltransferase [Candidatus Melainabacteria bacterium]